MLGSLKVPRLIVLEAYCCCGQGLLYWWVQAHYGLLGVCVMGEIELSNANALRWGFLED